MTGRNGKGCVSVFAGPVQIEPVRAPTALFRLFNLARAAAVFQLRTTHRSPYTVIRCKSLAASQWAK